jgi:GntR family transcriptional regulator
MKVLDINSFVPLYHQLKEIILENIENNEWMPGDKIPSEHQLCEQYNVSRNTAKKAIEELVQKGSLHRIQGKGTFVSRPKIEQSLSGFYSFSKVMKDKGLNPKDIILEIGKKKPSRTIMKALQLQEGDDVIELKRLRCANNEPIILESSYLPTNIINDEEKIRLVGEIPLYDILANEFGIVVVRAKETFEPVLVRDYESTYLEVDEGNPALLLERITYDQNKRPIEFCKSVVRGDRCRFYTELV